MHCEFCGEKLILKRKGAQFCSTNCRVKFNQLKRRFLNKQLPLQLAIENCQKEYIIYQTERQEKTDALTLLTKQIDHLTNLIERKKQLFALDYENFKLGQLSKDDIHRYLAGNQYQSFLERLYESQSLWHFNSLKNKLKEDISELQQQKNLQYQTYKELFQKLEQCVLGLEKVQQVKQSYQQQVEQLDTLFRAKLDKKKKTPNRSSPSADQSVKMKDFLSKKFESIRLKDALGNFLGKMDRHQLCLAITGHPKAGKSYFLSAIAQSLSQHPFSVCYYQLDHGLSPAFKNMLKTYPLSSKRVVLKEAATLQSIRQDAMQYDCLLIDSFEKLGISYRHWNEVVRQFPKTIFVITFHDLIKSDMINSSYLVEIGRRENRPIATIRESRYDSTNLALDIYSMEMIHLE